jgi:hypothetical protein
MLDPMQAYHVSTHTPSQGYQDLDEEQSAQRHGHVVVIGRPLSSRVLCQVGKFLIRVGQKLAEENTSIELSKDTA